MFSQGSGHMCLSRSKQNCTSKWWCLVSPSLSATWSRLRDARYDRLIHCLGYQFLQTDYSPGGIDRVHRKSCLCSHWRTGSDIFLTGRTEMVFRASNDLELFGKLSYKTLQTIEQSQGFDGNPIYAILHEPIYCQGYLSWKFSSPSFTVANDFSF